MLDTPLRLLLIEDEEDHCALITRYLRNSAGDSVTLKRVARLEDGIRLLQDGEAFDAVLTDLNLPDSRGLATFREVRKSAHGTPLIALTSHSVTSDGVSLMQEGAHDFLPKSKLDGELLLRSILCAVERKRLNDAEIRLHEHSGQMEIARQIQMSILPEQMPEWPGLEAAAQTVPAEAVGGDYFDFITLPNGDHMVAIGDATGHGPGAALVMAMAAASVRTLAAIYSDLGEILTRLNDLMNRETPDFAFMTLCLIRIERENGGLFHANAGHPAPTILHQNGNRHCMESADGHVPIGMMPNVDYAESDRFEVDNGSLLYAVTDGITEALNPDRQLFRQQRLDHLVDHSNASTAAGLLTEIQNAVTAWRSGQPADDDQTAVVVRWNSDRKPDQIR